MRYSWLLVAVVSACSDSPAPVADAPIVIDSPPPLPLTPPLPMLISAQQHAFGTGMTAANLRFVNPSVGPNGKYNTERVGSCYISDCLHPIAQAWSGITAGTLSVTNGTTSITETPNVRGYYELQSIVGTTPSWTPGDTITVAATGDQVPAFTTTLTLPPAAAFNPAPTQIVHTQALTLNWSGGVGTVLAVLIHLGGTTEDYDDMRIVCEFDGASGTGTIPLEIMSRLDTSRSAALTIGNADIEHVMAGTLPIFAYTINGAQLTFTNVQ